MNICGRIIILVLVCNGGGLLRYGYGLRFNNECGGFGCIYFLVFFFSCIIVLEVYECNDVVLLRLFGVLGVRIGKIVGDKII